MRSWYKERLTGDAEWRKPSKNGKKHLWLPVLNITDGQKRLLKRELLTFIRVDTERLREMIEKGGIIVAYFPYGSFTGGDLIVYWKDKMYKLWFSPILAKMYKLI